MYKAKNQFDGRLDNLKLRFVVREGLLNNEIFGYNWSPTSSITTLRYLLADATKRKAIVHHIYFIEAFLQEQFKNRVFVKLESRYAE